MQVDGSDIATGLMSRSTTAGAGKSEKAKVADAATQFEGLMIEQMLRSAREAGGGGWMGEDESGSALSEMAEQQFASLLASGGGIGLAKMVTAGLEHASVPAKGAS